MMSNRDEAHLLSEQMHDIGQALATAVEALPTSPEKSNILGLLDNYLDSMHSVLTILRDSIVEAIQEGETDLT